jgi:hypothetical protein
MGPRHKHWKRGTIGDVTVHEHAEIEKRLAPLGDRVDRLTHAWAAHCGPMTKRKVQALAALTSLHIPGVPSRLAGRSLPVALAEFAAHFPALARELLGEMDGDPVRAAGSGSVEIPNDAPVAAAAGAGGLMAEQAANVNPPDAAVDAEDNGESFYLGGDANGWGNDNLDSPFDDPFRY